MKIFQKYCSALLIFQLFVGSRTISLPRGTSKMPSFLVAPPPRYIPAAAAVAAVVPNSLSVVKVWKMAWKECCSFGLGQFTLHSVTCCSTSCRSWPRWNLPLWMLNFGCVKWFILDLLRSLWVCRVFLKYSVKVVWWYHFRNNPQVLQALGDIKTVSSGSFLQPHHRASWLRMEQSFRLSLPWSFFALHNAV